MDNNELIKWLNNIKNNVINEGVLYIKNLRLKTKLNIFDLSNFKNIYDYKNKNLISTNYINKYIFKTFLEFNPKILYVRCDEKTLSKFEIFFENIKINVEEEFKDIEFCLLIMTSVELGFYFTQDHELQETIKRYDNEYPNKPQMKQAMKKALSLLNSVKLPYDSLWYKKTSMFSLITEFAKYYMKNKDIKINPEKISIKLSNLEKIIVQSKNEDPEKNKYSKYYKHMFQQTTSRTGRNARALVVAELFK